MLNSQTTLVYCADWILKLTLSQISVFAKPVPAVQKN